MAKRNARAASKKRWGGLTDDERERVRVVQREVVEGRKEREAYDLSFQLAPTGREDTFFMEFSPGFQGRAWLLDDTLKGERAKQLWVAIECDGRARRSQDWVFAKRFKHYEHVAHWLASIEKHLRRHLGERLLDAGFLALEEAIAKASVEHGVREIDMRALAESHAKQQEVRKKKALGVSRGARKGSKQSKAQLSKRQVEVDLPSFIREMGEDVTRDAAAKRFRLSNAKALDRALKHKGKPWRLMKAESLREE